MIGNTQNSFDGFRLPDTDVRVHSGLHPLPDVAAGIQMKAGAIFRTPPFISRLGTFLGILTWEYNFLP